MRARCTDTWRDTIRNRREFAERWAEGHDTLTIARDIGPHEHQVSQILARVQDTRRVARPMGGARA